MRKIFLVMVIVLLGTASLLAVDISVSGFLDADIVTDFKGNYFAGNEFDLTLGIKFTSNVSVFFYATAYSGRVPAAGPEAGSRFPDLAFDGVALEVTDALSKGDKVTVNDLAFQFGKLDGYYFYKRLSIITPETFARGIAYSMSVGGGTLSTYLGVDKGTMGAIVAASFELGSISLIASYYEQGVSSISTARTAPFLPVGMVVKGLPLSGKLTIGGVLPVDGGSLEIKNSSFNIVYDFNTSLGGSLSLAGMLMYSDDSTGLNSTVFGSQCLAGINFENILIYLEPGISLSKKVAFGLPVEYHKMNDTVGTEQIWIVPTLYFYPASGVEVWVWGQVVLQDKAEPLYFSGIESIVKF